MLTLYLLSPDAGSSFEARAAAAFRDAPTSRDGAALTTRGGVEIAALPLYAPYPNDAPIRACEGNLFWPKARDVVAAHKSHVVLAASHPSAG